MIALEAILFQSATRKDAPTSNDQAPALRKMREPETAAL
jgi:hypothetical protein